MMNEQIESLDVLIVGAGISGLGMCYNMKKKRAHTSFAVIEGRENIGGTWDLFKYPGIRSDSDMYTFAYSFKPWTEKEYIGSAERINNYLKELVRDENLDHYIRFQQKVTAANWDSSQNHWLVTISRQDGSDYKIAAKFLSCCSGYYNYEHGYLPKFKGYDDFQGTVAHPQHWPEELDYSNKRVIVIGSGATAVTVVPAMAKKAAHVTMVQRSPSYIFSRPASDVLFRILSRILPKGITNRIMRTKYATLQQLAFVFSKRFPNEMRKLVRFMNKKDLANAADVDVHFNPNYKPWDQRMALVPDADLFNSVRSGKTTIVTDHIERFTKTGILMKSGEQIDADIIVPATGLDIQLWGKMNLTVDGNFVEGNTLTNYKGMMFSQVPNFVWVFGYTNASWTLKAELTYDYVCRLLEHMEQNGYQSVHPHQEPNAERVRMLDLQSGYVQRSEHLIPSQGTEFPWCNKDLYIKDVFAIKHSKLADDVLRFDDNDSLAGFHKPSPDKSTDAPEGESELITASNKTGTNKPDTDDKEKPSSTQSPKQKSMA
ncbi:MAG: cation diffusion facilitator CzcD-associated flavoprotein CzcO [Oleiphilaceae bacterium]|jgi:cation diffusion facilitator CzcD-associated flavoprotein CzcO